MSIDLGKQVADARTARSWSQDRLALEAKTSQSTIDRVEKGGSVKLETRLKILRALDLDAPAPANDPSSVQYRAPPRFFTDRAVMPVFASAEGGNGALVISSEPYEYLPKPFTLDNVDNAFAVLIEGESMVPAFEPGDKVWVNPMLSHRRDTDVILYGDQDNQGRALIKRLRTFSATEWRVTQYNPAKDYALDRAEWVRCYRVVGKFSKG
ncbi:helix-turn-helix domain-containing protein [Lichenihabitans psoromatis]|uniref:helix-turn-helix domain-containing protein n=1 Tax=Lichenihabitans psoromatis TaxID=2528642 RepID=UPI0010385B97|nr:S24 family peptidase [Lichenihabitans psoromatis]